MSNTADAPPVPTLESFLRAEVAPRFQELVGAAEHKIATAQKELEDLRAAKGTIAWEIEGPSPSVRYVNIADGAMAHIGALG